MRSCSRRCAGTRSVTSGTTSCAGSWSVASLQLSNRQDIRPTGQVNESQRLMVAEERAQGATMEALAAKFRVGKATIRRALHEGREC